MGHKWALSEHIAHVGATWEFKPMLNPHRAHIIVYTHIAKTTAIWAFGLSQK